MKKNPSSTNLSRTTKTSKNTNFESFSLTLNLAKRSYQQYYVNFSIRLLGVKRLRFFNRPHQTQNSHCGKNVNSVNQMTGKLEIFFLVMFTCRHKHDNHAFVFKTFQRVMFLKLNLALGSQSSERF